MSRKLIRMETIKLALDNIEDAGLDPKEVLKDSIGWLYERYSVTGNRSYLEQALYHIQAYVQLGFSYEEEQTMFDRILDILGVRKFQIMFLDERYTKTVRLNKHQVRSMIGRWNPKIQSMPINDVVDDVIDKVKYEKEGVYTYVSGRRQLGDREIAKDEYRLIIYGHKAQFFDIGKKLYYTIQKEC